MELDHVNINQLSQILKRRESDILDGRHKVSLTASLLQKINYTLHELEFNNLSSLYSTANVSEESVKYLQDLLPITPKLSVTQKLKRETWRVDLSRFNSLKYLELNKVPMHLVEGFQVLRPQLQVLVCERCTDCLEEILGPAENVWGELRTAKLCYNDFVFLCPFTNTPWLQYLDLSYNRIEDKLSLQTLKNLTYLNLSFNFLTSVPMLSEDVFRKLKVLLLNNNYIQELSAISVFESLEVLDVSHNLLADHSAVSPILCLPNLRCLNLSNNPISYHPHHRFHTCSYLHRTVVADQFLLDGLPLNLMEQKEIGRRGETFRQHGISVHRDLTCLPSGSLSQPVARSVPKRKVRDVVIEEGTSNPKPKSPLKPLETSQEHLETKRQMEEIRERFGGDHWLHSHAGSFVQDLLGLQKSTGNGVLSSTPLTFPNSPKLTSPLSLIEEPKSQLESMASEDYVNAMTTQAIIERVDLSTSESSDQEQQSASVVTVLPGTSTLKESTQETVQEEAASSGLDDEGYGETTEDETLVEENQPEEEEEVEEECDGQLWLVQQKSEEGNLTDIFLTLNEKEIKERSTETIRTITSWSLESVKSCEKINSDPPTIQLMFNTIRRACQERTYIMEYADSQELLKRVRSFLEARSLSAMNVVAYRCMKCSSMFSVETQPTVFPSLTALESGVSDNKKSTKCPTCGSTLVVEMEEAPLPSSDRETDSTPTNRSVSVNTSPLKHSPSECSIGSAASLEQRLETEPVVSGGGATKEGTPTPRKYAESDIEVISNPSQSSIEVLEVQARLQGTLTPSRKRSNEERPTVAVPQLNTVPEVQSNLVALTESSSSGSLTDSVCTAYESNPVPSRRSGMSDVPEESAPNSVNNTYTSLLEGLIQSVTSKLSPKNSPTKDSILDNKSPYSFSDFAKVDHRVKFHLFQNTFNDDNEELLFLLRGQMVSSSGELLPNCLVVSTHSIYPLSVVSQEVGDDASDWYQQRGSHHLGELVTVSALPWSLGVSFQLKSTVYVALLDTPQWTDNFLRFIQSVQKQDCSALQRVTIEEVSSTKLEGLLEQLIARSANASSSPVESSIRHLCLCRAITLNQDKDGDQKLKNCLLVVTSTELLVIQPEFLWLLPSSESQPSSAACNKLTNIVEVSLSALTLNLHYLNESENQEETWSIELSSAEMLNSVVETIRGPWEQMFSIPLTLSEKH